MHLYCTGVVLYIILEKKLKRYMTYWQHITQKLNYATQLHGPSRCIWLLQLASLLIQCCWVVTIVSTCSPVILSTAHHTTTMRSTLAVVSRVHRLQAGSARLLVFRCVHGLAPSVVVLQESPCPRGPNYKSLSLDHKVPKNFQGLCILQTVCYVWSCDVHKFCYSHCAWGYS